MPIISAKRLFKSFQYAFRGVWHVLRSEQNMRVHVAASVLVVFLMFYLDTSLVEKAVLILSMTLVFSAEIINSALERIIDIVKPRLHPEAKTMKDIMAAMVLIAAMGSLIIGGMIFIPKLFDKFF